jgi:hypothetical protein
MSETRIKIKELEMNGETAIRIAECLKKHEPEIWKVLSGELKQALGIDDIVESVCEDEELQPIECEKHGSCKNCPHYKPVK